MNYKVTVLGAGLAGCEAALWLAGKGVQVDLYVGQPLFTEEILSSDRAYRRCL